MTLAARFNATSRSRNWAGIPSILVLLAAGALAQTQPESDFIARLAALSSFEERDRMLASESVPATVPLIQACNDRGFALVGKQQFADAIWWYRTGEKYSDQLQSVSGRAVSLSGLSEAYRQSGEYEMALVAQSRSLEFARAWGERQMISGGLSNLAVIQMRLGRAEEALVNAKESLAVAQSEPPLLRQESSARNALAIYYSLRSDFHSALEQHLRTVEIDRQLGLTGNLGIALGNIGGLYSDQGDYGLAIEYYKKSLPLAEQVGFRITFARFTGNLAETYFLAGDNLLARQNAEKALELARALNHREIIASSLTTLAEIDWSQSRRASAVANALESSRILDQISNKDILCNVLPLLGKYQVESGDVEHGIATLERVIAISRDQGYRSQLYLAATELGKAYRKLKRPKEAREHLLEAISTIESVRLDVSGGAVARQRYFDDKLDPYIEMMQLAVSEGSILEAFAFAERGRTQSLLDVLRGSRVSANKQLTPQERDREKQLGQNIAALNLKLARAKETGARAAAQQTEAKLAEARLELEAFDSQLYTAHPELRGQRLDAPPAGAKETAALLPDAATVLLEYVVTGERTYLFAISRNQKPALIEIPVSSRDLTARVDRLIRQISARAMDYRAAARDLDRLLIEPARAAIAGRSTLVIVADRALWKLPFAALESASGQALLERHTPFYAPSATVLRELMSKSQSRRKSGNPSERTLLAIGNPPKANLPALEKGLASLAALYGSSRSRVLTGESATETVFKASSGRYDVIHIGSHGVLDNQNPLYSHISLAKDAANDGFLEAREMTELDLSAELVVLAACETAGGRSGGGEGLIGMTWAIFLAGSPATVASAWKVDEEATSLLMARFHQSLLSTSTRPQQAIATKAASLRTAALAVRSDARYRHPFYWAAFSLSGNGF